MRTIINFFAIVVLMVTTSCKKNTTAPAAPPQSQTNSSTASTSLTAQETQLSGKWYYDRSETISNGTITSQFTYSTAPALNSVEFKCTLSAAADVNNPNYKEMTKVINGSVIPNMVWKINEVGILSMNLNDADPKATLDTLNSTRLVYIQYTSLQPLNGTRYYLNK